MDHSDYMVADDVDSYQIGGKKGDNIEQIALN